MMCKNRPNIASTTAPRVHGAAPWHAPRPPTMPRPARWHPTCLPHRQGPRDAHRMRGPPRQEQQSWLWGGAAAQRQWGPGGRGCCNGVSLYTDRDNRKLTTGKYQTSMPEGCGREARGTCHSRHRWSASSRRCRSRAGGGLVWVSGTSQRSNLLFLNAAITASTAASYAFPS